MAMVRIKINGKVQGVFFRHSAKQQAGILQIAGWIKNLPEGSVLCEASGSEESLRKFIDWCKQGPANAHVTETNIEFLADHQSDRKIIDFQIIS